MDFFRSTVVGCVISGNTKTAFDKWKDNIINWLFSLVGCPCNYEYRKDLPGRDKGRTARGNKLYYHGNNTGNQPNL